MIGKENWNRRFQVLTHYMALYSEIKHIKIDPKKNYYECNAEINTKKNVFIFVNVFYNEIN